jgi:hypothetical protein
VARSTLGEVLEDDTAILMSGQIPPSVFVDYRDVAVLSIS